MTDRDTFAAAALAGLIANGDYSVESTPLLAYRMADAMLAVRDSRIATDTNHDAAPAATASVESVAPQPTTRGDSDGTDKADPLTRDCGTGDTPPPHATPPHGSVPGEGSVPRSGTENEPVAWAVAIGGGNTLEATFCGPEAREEAIEWCHPTSADRPVPLYRSPQPTLTDEEREAVDWAIDAASGMASAEPWAIDTLRKLLERLA